MLDAVYIFLLDNKDVLSSLSSLAVIISTIFVAIQARLFFNDYRKRNKKEEFSKSFELTKFYTSIILPKMPKIQRMFELCDVTSNIKSIRSNIKHFDKEECSEFLDPDEFRKKIQSIKLKPIEQILPLYAQFANTSISNAYMEFYRYMALISEHEDSDNLVEEYKINLCNAVIGELSIAANDLEYFSMFFNSNLAESEVVYESLHQTFLAYVRLLYPVISYANTRSDYSKKYYTHIRDLYSLWSKKEGRKEMQQALAFDKLRGTNPKI